MPSDIRVSDFTSISILNRYQMNIFDIYPVVMLRAAKTRAVSEPSIETPSLERAEHVLFI